MCGLTGIYQVTPVNQRQPFADAVHDMTRLLRRLAGTWRRWGLLAPALLYLLLLAVPQASDPYHMRFGRNLAAPWQLALTRPPMPRSRRLSGCVTGTSSPRVSLGEGSRK